MADTSNGRTNLSGLKLTYTPKTGIFKGTFTVYTVSGKLHKTKATVKGVVVNGVGYADVTYAKSSVTSRMVVR